MAECIYTKEYNQVARRTVGKTVVSAIFSGYHSPRTRKILIDGNQRMRELEAFAKAIINTESNLFWRAAVNYLGKKVDDAISSPEWYKI